MPYGPVCTCYCQHRGATFTHCPTGSGLTIPNATRDNGPEERAIAAARIVLGQLSNNFLGAGVQRNATFCMDARGNACPVGQRATVACTRGTETYIVFNVRGFCFFSSTFFLCGVGINLAMHFCNPIIDHRRRQRCREASSQPLICCSMASMKTRWVVLSGLRAVGAIDDKSSP